MMNKHSKPPFNITRLLRVVQLVLAALKHLVEDHGRGGDQGKSYPYNFALLRVLYG